MDMRQVTSAGKRCPRNHTYWTVVVYYGEKWTKSGSYVAISRVRLVQFLESQLTVDRTVSTPVSVSCATDRGTTLSRIAMV